MDTVATELRSFVDSVLRHMSELGVSDTDAHHVWDLVGNATADEQQYCRLVGALLLFPVRGTPDIDRVLDALSGKLDERLLADLCQASDAATIRQISGLAETIYSALPDARDASIAELTDIELPQDRSAQVSAASDKDSEDWRLVLADGPEPQLRFAATRAAFLAWSSPSNAARLVTPARTLFSRLRSSPFPGSRRDPNP